VREIKKVFGLIGDGHSDVSPSPSVVHHTAAKKLSRRYNLDAMDVFETGSNEALITFEESPLSKDSLEKVVVARRADLHLAAELSGLDVMKK